MNIRLWLIWMCTLLVMILAIGELRAGTGAIPKGPDVLILKPNLLFKGGDVKIMTNDTDDPTAFAKDADEGTAYIQNGTGTWFRKLDAGTSLNWGLFVGTVSGSGTDNFVPHWDGTNTGLLEDTTLSITDTGVASGLTQFTLENLRLDGNTLSTTSGDLILVPADQVTLPSLTGNLPLLLNAANEIVTSTINLVSGIDGILPIANGGTNSDTALNGDRMMISTATSIVEASALADGELFIGQTGGTPLPNTLTGTADQVSIANGSGSITLSLPQNIALTSTPTFSGASLTSLSDGSVLFISGTGTISEDNSEFNYDVNNSILTLLASLDLASQSELRFYEQDGNGTNYLGFTAPDAVTADFTWKLPDGDGASGEFLSTDGAGNLGWATAAAASATVDVVSTTVEFTRVQANTFNELDAIYHNGATWELAQANNSSTLAEYIVITASAASFTASKFGVYTKAAHGLSVGDHYFLSSTIAGGSSTSEPPSFSSPLFYVEDANTIHMEVLRPSVSIGFASGALRYEFLVGNSQDVIDGSADFDSVQTAINFATDGNKITILPRTFTETITINKKVIIEGFAGETVISGTVTFTATSGDESILRDLKVAGDITVNSDATRVQDINQRIGDTINNLGTDNIIRDVITR